MLNSFFGFTRIPFQPLPTMTTIYNSDSLLFLQQRFIDFCITKGLALICGESGCGKTTAIQYLMAAHLNTHRFKPFYFIQYPGSAKGFLRLIITKLGYTPKFYMENVLSQFPTILENFYSQTKTIPFFIFDEAQNLSPSVLEELRLITNLELPCAPLMVIVAHGAFKDRLKLACFQPLRYRLSLMASIEPLSKSDISNYIAFHLKLSGSTIPIFSDDAITSIFNASKGLPRLINRICLEALYLAAQKNINPIDPTIIDSVAVDFI